RHYGNGSDYVADRRRTRSRGPDQLAGGYRRGERDRGWGRISGAGGGYRDRGDTLIEARRRRLGIADGDPTGNGSAIVVDAVVGDLQVVAEAVDENAATALRAVGEAHAVDTRRVAEEVGRIEHGCRVAVSQPVVIAVVRQGAGAAVEIDAAALSCVQRAAVGGIVVLQALGQNCDRRPFIGAHQGRFLQHLHDVAVHGRSPAEN